ncbi:diguanylate cyclase [uncultured Pseudacidovorax sp.]|uniref:GGDEF domain-containing protein n=1 Tax=uncultured Pseudacidovorax sp. TaxID=679313 RepID=UPI0025F6ABF2|nr:GGDEF domain-containing protein [uncultured Pseudacidovorax sp.]
MNDADTTLRRRRVEALYDTVPISGFMGLAGAIMLALVFWRPDRHALVLGWLVASCTPIFARLALRWAYRRYGSEAVPGTGWVWISIVLMAFTGLAWGIGLAWMLVHGDADEVPVVVGTALGAVAMTMTNMAYWQTHAAFQVPILGSMAVAVLIARPGFASVLATASVVLSLAQLLLARRMAGIYVQALRVSLDNERLAQDLAARSHALEQANFELELLSRADPLTGLANRRSYMEWLNVVWARAAQEDLPVSLLSADVDRFKLYNDAHGHGAGDRCLQAVASALAHACRSDQDQAARPGGEEFAIVLPATELRDAVQVAERVRQGVIDASRDAGWALPAGVTVSVGVACRHPREGGSIEDLLREADQALYLAKDRGRNRVEAAPAVGAV